MTLLIQIYSSDPTQGLGSSDYRKILLLSCGLDCETGTYVSLFQYTSVSFFRR